MTRPALAAALLAAVLALALPGAAVGQDFTVTKGTDSADGACDADCSLREAVIAANAAPGADRILLGEGTFTLSLPGAGEDAAATGDLDVTSDRLVVQGAGAGRTVIDGGGVDRVFHVLAAGGLLLDGVTVRNGQAAGDGGGVLSSGALEVRRSSVTGNAASGDGGGVFISAGSLEMSDGVVSGNTGAGGSAGIRTLTSTTAVLARVEVIGNDAGAQDAGGIENGGAMTLTEVTVAGNTAGSSAGGVRHNSGSLTIERSTISGNRALTSDSGGLFASAGTLALREVTISGNQAASNGGGLRIQGSTIASLDGVTVAGNASGSGGALAAFVPVLVRGTIVGDNAGAQCQNPASLVSLGGNVAEGADCASFTAPGDRLGVDPGLGPLAANGGRTRTHALLPGSPALDTAGAACAAADQRGVPRPLGGACDAGAFEAQPDLRAAVAAAPGAVTAGGRVTYTITVANGGVAGAGDAALALALPDGLVPESITPSQGACTSAASCALGAIGPSGQASVVLTARLRSPGAPVVTATATATGDANPADDAASAATRVAPRLRPTVLALPRVAGRARVGATLRCRAFRFGGASARSIRWLRDGKVIPRRTRATYRVVRADRGRVISCAVRARNPAGAVRVVSPGVLVRR